MSDGTLHTRLHIRRGTPQDADACQKLTREVWYNCSVRESETAVYSAPPPLTTTVVKGLKMATRKYTLEQQLIAFWQKVDRSGGDDACWEWLAGTRGGYGLMRWRGKTTSAHRVSWELAHGSIPDGLDVLHSCDNPRCVYPAHLFLGTHQDNMVDMLRKGRGNKPSGEKNGNSKLTDAQVAEIRRRYAAGGITQTQLGAEFDVAHTNIGYIVRGVTRK